MSELLTEPVKPTTREGQPGVEESTARTARAEVKIDETKAIVCYANFCRVTGTPEELILDFGLNSNPIGGPARIEVAQRLVMNYYTSKRLWQALSVSIQRHEAAFGVLETNVQKRLM